MLLLCNSNYFSIGTSIVQHDYTCDSTNNIVEYLNFLDGSTSYDYDFLGQLIGADYANAEITDESYTYDSNGNRVVANGSNYTTSTNNELTSDSSYTYTYDDEGNRISKTNSTHRELYEWDYRNRLTSVTKQEFNAETQEWTTVQIVEYTYDYNNVWIRKVLDSNGDGTADSKTIFIPENYQTTVQLDDTNLTDANGPTITHHYLWTPNTQDKLLADVTANNVLWSLTDHLGSIRDIVQQTSSGLVVPAHIIYDAYGNIISCTDSTGQPISNPILFAYTGKAFDVSTQLQNNINRWYDATTGRWLSTDPIGFEGNDTNLYRYVGNGVICHKDIWGLEEIYTETETCRIYPSSVNCLGFALGERGSVQPLPQKSLVDVMNSYGYSCHLGVSALDCKDMCGKCNSYIMVYIQLFTCPPISPRKSLSPKTRLELATQANKNVASDHNKIFLINLDEVRAAFGVSGYILDFHAILGTENGEYIYQPSDCPKGSKDDLTQNPISFKPTDENSDYSEYEIFAKMCCCKNG